MIPANILLSGCELELTGVGREYLLREALSDVMDDYDYIMIDTPPALSILTINAYTAADKLIIPMIAEILSLQGIAQLKETIFAVKKYYNKDLEITGILLNKYNPRLVLTKEVEELAGMIAEQLGTKILSSRISTNVSLAEAPAHGISIMEYAPTLQGDRRIPQSYQRSDRCADEKITEKGQQTSRPQTVKETVIHERSASCGRRI